MSEWITDRRPTAEDAVSNRVWMMNEDGTINIYMWSCVGDRPWMQMDAPEPYVEPKRVRRTGCITGEWLVPNATYMETFADDPDFDELIDAARAVVKDHTNGMNEIHPQNVQRLFICLNEPLKPRSKK